MNYDGLLEEAPMDNEDECEICGRYTIRLRHGIVQGVEVYACNKCLDPMIPRSQWLACAYQRDRRTQRDDDDE